MALKLVSPGVYVDDATGKTYNVAPNQTVAPASPVGSTSAGALPEKPVPNAATRGKDAYFAAFVGGGYGNVTDAAKAWDKAHGVTTGSDSGSAWTQFRDAAEAVGVGVVNYYLPGSAALTTGLTSQGAQNLLGSPQGQAGLAVAGAAGADAGNTFSIPYASDAGKYVGQITGSTILANATTGAIQGAGTGALQAAAAGKNIGQGALKGAEFGGASKGVGTAATDVLGTSRLGQGASAGLGTFAGVEATGGNRTEALRSGLASGAATALFPTDPKATKAQQAATGFERQATSKALSQLLAPKDTGGKSQPSSGSSAASTVLGATQQVSPGSAALAQALRVGDAGGPIFGSEGKDKKKKGAWNLESLRYMG